MPRGRRSSAITIADIAREAGVSTATVSRTLRGKEWVSPETREKISRVARRLNYHPNLQARALVSKKPDGVEIVIPQTAEFAFANPYYAEHIKGIWRGIKESGQHLVFSFAGGESYARWYHHRLVGGIIVLGHRMDDPRVEEAWKAKVPMVLIPGYPHFHKIPSVDMDNIGGAFRAVDHLAALGHRRIAFVGGATNSKYHADRLRGYLDGLEKNKLAVLEELILDTDFTPECAYRVMKGLLSMPQIPTAVLVITDHCALGVLKAIKESGYRVVEDISVVGFGDVSFASMIQPPLTTIREPYQEVGYQAAGMLLKVIQGKRISPKHITLPVEFVLRESTAPPPNLMRRKQWQSVRGQ